MFVKRKPAFDVVIDGLNVANINMDKSKQSETVRKMQFLVLQSNMPVSAMSHCHREKLGVT